MVYHAALHRAGSSSYEGFSCCFLQLVLEVGEWRVRVWGLKSLGGTWEKLLTVCLPQPLLSAKVQLS